VRSKLRKGIKGITQEGHGKKAAVYKVGKGKIDCLYPREGVEEIKYSEYPPNMWEGGM